MKILLSAFACSPIWGSEPGVGWRWATELGQYNEVVVLTHSYFQPVIDVDLAKTPRSVVFVYYQPSWLKRWFKPEMLNSRLYYLLWQVGAWRRAVRLVADSNFDLVHHLTWGNFRFPSFLGLLGRPFVFGPVGGGETAPFRLLRSLPRREQLKELARELVRATGKFDPLVWLCLWKSKLILCRTRETLKALPRWARNKAEIKHEIGAPALAPRDATNRTNREPLRLMYAGRLLGWKGIHLSIRAVSLAIGQGADATLTIVGKGPFSDYLVALATKLDVLGQVRFLDYLPREDLLELYRSMDCLIFPSLHDSGGTVVLEAMSRGLPVICLDLGGPPEFVDSSCGRVIRVESRDEEKVVQALADAVLELATSPALTVDLGAGALRRAGELTWSAQVERAYEAIRRVL